MIFVQRDLYVPKVGRRDDLDNLELKGKSSLEAMCHDLCINPSLEPYLVAQ